MINKTIKDKILDSPKQLFNMEELWNVIRKNSPNTLQEYINFAFDPIYDLSMFKLFLESKGLYLSMQPEFYTKGINWNWQLWWYRPKEEWKEDKHEGNKYFSSIVSGTYMYGDNNEYPTREKAELGAFELAFRLLENNAIEIGQPDENT